MKKLCTLFFFLVIATLSAQTKEKTLEWLTIKQTEKNLKYPVSNRLNQPKDNKLEMTVNSIKVYDSNGGSAQENWKDINKISYDKIGYKACIVNLYFKKQYNGEPVFIKIGAMDVDQQIIFEKFKLMATLNGAKIVE